MDHPRKYFFQKGLSSSISLPRSGSVRLQAGSYSGFVEELSKLGIYSGSLIQSNVARSCQLIGSA